MRKIFYLLVIVAFTLTSCDKNELENTLLNPSILNINGLNVFNSAEELQNLILSTSTEQYNNRWRDITIDAKSFEKIKLDSTSVSNAEGVLKSINALGKTFSTWLESADEKIGYTYLNYYDDPSLECSTGSAPSGGYLTVKYKDHE